MTQRIILSITQGSHELETIVDLEIEENNRDDVQAVIRDVIELIYDGGGEGSDDTD